jgi:GTP cyclohydrolase I
MTSVRSQSMRLVDESVSAAHLARDVARLSKTERLGSIVVPVLHGAIAVDEFLSPEARQHLEGQIYSYGRDLSKVYRTSRTGYGENELSIPDADQQVPLLGELRREIDELLLKIFPGEISAHAMQLRELTPKSSGHPRHVDYEKGADLITKSGETYGLTSISLSLPISWNDGVAPVFIVETPDGDVRQDRPGSLVIFGPTLFHAHPPTDQFTEPYLWLVTQVFFKIKEPRLTAAPAIRKPSVSVGMEGPTVARWADHFLTDPSALTLLQDSEERIRRAYAELLSGYETDPRSVLNEVERVEEHAGLVSETGIHFTSFCGHHFLPFHGTIDVTYEPRHVITGLGKIPRLVEVVSKRLQLQEFVVRDVAEYLREAVDAKGVYVVARAVHLCMHSRGPKSPATTTTCSYASGSLKHFLYELNPPADQRDEGPSR